MFIRAKHLILAAGVAAAAALAMPAAAAPKPDLWERWTAHDPASDARVDHSAWDGFLERFRVAGGDGIARLRYGAVDEDAKAALDGYVAMLEAVPVSALDRPEQMAYWFNFYNALTVRVILDHYPVDTIRDIDISPGLFANGPWGAKLVEVEGEALSLDDIEHRVLRPIWADPRIHYGVNCAALGCPNLPPEAFTRDNTERLLQDGAAAFVNHPRGVWFEDGRLHVSSIYAWFDEDFGSSDAGVIAHLSEHAEPALKARLAEATRIAGDAYDWDLNDAGGD